MNDVIEFFEGLFSTDKWPPRWYCGEWSDFHGWLYISSDLMIWLAYFLIPIIILQYFAGKKNVIKFTRIYLLFATFILLCGSTHFIDAMMFWVPMYHLNALVRLATGIVSLFTVYHLFRILPQVFQQRTNLELELEIARRIEAERKLADANANLEAFAYVASHDLQEPLRKIRTFTSMLFRNNADSFDEKNKVLADKIIASSTRMQTMIQDVLTLSTIRVNDEFETVNLKDAIGIALEDLEVKILEKKAVVRVADLPHVIGNREYLAQLFMNLIGNSVKFSKNTPLITITGLVNANKVLIYVRDNGIGMSEEHMDKIFFAFQRLHSRTEYEGSGIGLAICKRIVELHRGRISVESIPGEGTTFIVELPKA
ncbi:sensor histidine kinase [Runella slithyformis]|uniref:histidine kinase n=1 Tax=Runella slithyformis (strain ATCC 29530 / DSM 19594 / LMG 11500 / NCIMB 11436 / LSU 4) TaxID=761193 RepID=A0A7U3ZP18_RUNSL|nr:ATP-binding protein [Runella slithyformis]AEI50746.1 integral membrane sensor signal transduction histidine kinase [Runella slithyformis DSM 19594]